MLDFILTVSFILLVVFLVSSLIGAFLAIRDIKKNKNSVSEPRLSRQERIKAFDSDAVNSSDMSVLSDIANLSPEQQEIFKSELCKKFNGEV